MPTTTNDLLGYELEDWMPMEPAKGPPLPKHLEIYWPWYKLPAAEFRVSNLIISPFEVNPGQVVTITAKVINIGTQAGDYTIKLGGDFTGEQSLTLEPTESRTISFEAVPDAAKTYHISVDGLTGTFQATEAPVEIVDFDLTRPTVTPETITPGTDTTITCPITSRCTKPQTITVKVIIYEGSLLPGHGAVIAIKTSPTFSISPEETYNVIVHHTAVAGTIDRRDIEVEIYIASKLIKQSEWDDVYYVEKPAVVIDFPALTILDVEGIPFTSVGTETMQDWEAFGRCLKEAWGTPLPIDPRQIYWIEDGVGLAMCIKTKVGALGTPTSETLKQCGLEHPEYLSEYAKAIRPPITTWVMLTEMDKNVTGEWGEKLYVGQVLYETELYTVTVVSFTTVPSGYFDPYQGWIYIDLVERVQLTYTYKEMTNWDTFGHQAACDYCSGALAPFKGPVATLAEPIVMDVMRGVTLSCAIKKVTPGDFDWYIEGTLHYEPAFDAPMPPPAFRGRSLQTVNPQHPPFPPSLDVNLKSLFARGYYYRGIYNGIVSLYLTTVQMPDYPYDGGRFRIKNLARVTGEGTV